MEVQDLKVESASVFVTNANQENAKYRISSHFNTRKGILTRIDNGNVLNIEENETVARFSKYLEDGKSYSVNYYGKAVDNTELQCEINEFIYEYITLGEAKSNKEINE